jgi:hypothetical protein
LVPEIDVDSAFRPSLSTYIKVSFTPNFNHKFSVIHKDSTKKSTKKMPFFGRISAKLEEVTASGFASWTKLIFDVFGGLYSLTTAAKWLLDNNSIKNLKHEYLMTGKYRFFFALSSVINDFFFF